jgi:hypothetical protein
MVVGRFAFKFARDWCGRASNLCEAKLYRTANATRRGLPCPVLWVSGNGFVQVMRAAKPLTDMMSLDEYRYSAVLLVQPSRMMAQNDFRHGSSIDTRSR